MRGVYKLTLCISPVTDKLTKEEEEIYKLQHDLERTAISQKQSKKSSEVSSLYFTVNIRSRYFVQVEESAMSH